MSPLVYPGREPDLDQLCIATIRILAMDAVQRARSGHPGTPMAMAPVAYALWQRHLRFERVVHAAHEALARSRSVPT